MTAIDSTFRPADWQPLQRALEAEFGKAASDATGAFWFVGFEFGPDDVGELRLYEHSATRRVIALDSTGNGYRWSAEMRRYCRVSASEALVRALV